jgi:hypothetical protein
MSNYLSMTQPSQIELDRRVINQFGPLLRKDKRYGSEVAAVLNSSRSNKEKKEALVGIIAKKQKAPNGFLGGAKRSTRSRRLRRRTHKRRTSRS